jgi:hypothetical protein
MQTSHAMRRQLMLTGEASEDPETRCLMGAIGGSANPSLQSYSIRIARRESSHEGTCRNSLISEKKSRYSETVADVRMAYK